MSNLFKSSIGKKLIMSLSGLFLITFIGVHLSLNLLILFDSTGELYNMGAHFMATNPLIKIMEPILAAGFVFHILWSFILAVGNKKARPSTYNSGEKVMSKFSAAQNMLVLGGMTLVFLGIHIYNFWYRIKIAHDVPHIPVDGVQMEDTFGMVKELFQSPCYSVLYIVGAILLGLHISHGLWSAFQSIGVNNDTWRPRLNCIAKLVAILFAVGFAIIPIYFMICG